MQPVLWARYGSNCYFCGSKVRLGISFFFSEKGKECCENLTDLSADQVLQKIRSVAQ